MSRLKTPARALVDAASRGEALPTAEHMNRVRGAVLRQIAAGAVVAAAGSSSSSAWASVAVWSAGGAGKIALFAVVGAIAGGAAIGVHGLRSAAPSAAPFAPAISLLPALAASAATEGEPAIAAEEDEDRAPAPPRAPVPRATRGPAPDKMSLRREAPAPSSAERESATPFEERGSPAIGAIAAPPASAAEPPDTLPRRLEVLRQIRSELADRQAPRALALYRENEALFRGGALEPEARAALVAALCQLGLADDARRERARFLAAFPSSHLARRLAAGCGEPGDPRR